ncbi:hypothetical protein [Lysobacter enzymogenes]|uniref:hypothetical protein n=1 Tax=Lysobacter enzymogenes TaxID=69 RepID=UPI001116B791|nr:hypothetical protein [Lysobacter enzymogenes]UZW61445.1 hypothetical protein BV903_003855 [Lysobacter enzymogenes]
MTITLRLSSPRPGSQLVYNAAALRRCASARIGFAHRHKGDFIGYLLPLSNTAAQRGGRRRAERGAAGAVQARHGALEAGRRRHDC